jgi:glycosyltransferase involved in cell wall biosynthesis
VLAQTSEPHEVIVEHQPDGTVASARNTAAERATGSHLIFLDADDELDAGYVAAMQHALTGPDDDAMLTPRVSYIVKGRAQTPKFWPEKPLSEGNWMVIGTMLNRERFLRIGGFDSRPHAFEDWSCFARMWKDGCQPVKVPAAIYRAHWMPGSRNKRLSREEQVTLHYELGREIFPDEYPPAWLEQHMRNARRMKR